MADRQTDVSEAEQIIKRLEPKIGNASGEQAERLRRRIAERKQSIQTLTAAIERWSEKVVVGGGYCGSHRRSK
ncbi:MAG TPA: hypothetical protein VL133_06350 [Devosia sp.]|nr:hypothetical protein [Devosia sp.]